MTKIRPFPLVICALLFAIVYTQVTGHLSFTNGGIENFFWLFRIQDDRIISHQYLSLVTGHIFDFIHKLGGNRMSYYAYAYNFIFAVMPLLPLPYYLWKRKEGDPVIILPLIIASLVYSLADLYLFSEHIFGISLCLLLMGGIYYSKDGQSLLEKAWLIILAFMSYFGGISLIWLAPGLFAFSLRSRSEKNKKFLLCLCAAVAIALGFILQQVIIERLNISFFKIAVDAKLNVKLMSFGLLFHLLLLGSLFLGLISNRDKKSILVCALAGFTLLWFDWTMSQYMNQRLQDANIFLVSVFCAFIIIVGFWNIKRITVDITYPFLIAALFGTFWLQSFHKMKITSFLHHLYQHCSGKEHTSRVLDTIIRNSYDSLYQLPNLSVAACLLKDLKPKYVLGDNVETIEFEKFDTMNVFIPEYIK